MFQYLTANCMFGKQVLPLYCLPNLKGSHCFAERAGDSLAARSSHRMELLCHHSVLGCSSQIKKLRPSRGTLKLNDTPVFMHAQG